MTNELLPYLEEKKWAHKYGRYNSCFESIETISEVNHPEISIVMISWRLHQDTLENLIRIHGQRETNSFELIFVDNGGKPGEFEMLKPYLNKYIRLSRNMGACVSRNIGSIFAKSSILLFLEDDGLANRHLVESHILIHKRFKIVAARGACLPKTNNIFNELQTHYYLDNVFFPMYANIEGNTSYDACSFFKVGGWNDDIEFGYEGRDLAIRLYRSNQDLCSQIYAPICMIYHDYAVNEKHLNEKRQRQEKANRLLAEVHPDWFLFIDYFHELFGRSDLIKERPEWHADEVAKIRFDHISNKVYEENFSKIYSNFIKTRIRLNQLDWLCRVLQKNKHRKICVFGAGAFGEEAVAAIKALNIEVDCYSDNNELIWNQTKQGINILPPSQLSKEYFICIASFRYSDIAEQLIGYGLEKGEDFIILAN